MKKVVLASLLFLWGCADAATVAPRQNLEVFNPGTKLTVANIFFEPDSYVVVPQYEGVIQEKANLLKRQPNLHAEVQGHADRSGTCEFALALAEQRAAVVAGMLTRAGAPAERVHSVSFGRELPLDRDYTREADLRNSRVEIIIYAEKQNS